MNTCDHNLDSSYDLCEQCLATVADGNAVLGRFELIGPGVGLAVDFDGGQVTVYMVEADTVVYGSGGIADAWVTFGDQLTAAPSVELHSPTQPIEAASTRDLALICEVVSGLATALLPIIEEAFGSGMSAEKVLLELRPWLDEQNPTPLTRRVFWATVRLIAVAAMCYMDRDQHDGGS